MSQTVNRRNAAPPTIAALYAPVESEMAQVESVLHEQIRAADPLVDEVARHGFLMGGKRLRPALLLLVARAVGRPRQAHAKLAAVMEMIHTATLIHDDVLDEADVRRHLSTVNSHWGNETSVLLGDFLFTKAFCLATTLDSNYASRVIGQATQVVCEGELRQIGNRANFDLPEDEYLQIIGAKTAELYSCCGRLGARFAGAGDETIEAMAEYGQCLGIAFQIADDLLDLLGDEEVTGKSLGTDLDQQKPTLPLIRVLQKAAPADRERILALLEQPARQRREALDEWFDRFDAFNYAREKARQFGRRAGQLAEALPESPARQSLLGLADFVVRRVR